MGEEFHALNALHFLWMADWVSGHCGHNVGEKHRCLCRELKQDILAHGQFFSLTEPFGLHFLLNYNHSIH
jgi:hypothetical protein